MDDKRYWAFLSYSHADRRWARWLHRALESYVVPRRLVGRPTAMGPAPRRLRPIFRDRDDLAADPHLQSQILQALEQSAWLIVICSPAAARSPWVNEEILRFKALHGEDRVLAVIVAGQPYASAVPGREAEECFPPALRARVGPDGLLSDQPVEPVAADAQPGKDGRRLARLKLLAGLLQVGLDELARRDAHRRLAQLAALSAAMGLVALVTTGLAITAFVERDAARDRRLQAEGLVEFMLGDLRRKLEPTGRLDVLDAVGARALAYYASEERRGLDDDALGRRARVLHLLGDLRNKRGDLDGALHDFHQASLATASLLAKKPGDGTRIFNHAQSVYYVGALADRRGQSQEAEQAFVQYKQLADRLVALDPRRDNWRAEVVYANENLGALWLEEGRFGEAASAFSRALGADLALAARSPDDRDRQTDLAGVHAWLSDAEASQGDLTAARRDRERERAIYQQLLARQAGDYAVKRLMVQNARALADIDAQQGHPVDAARQLYEATRQSEALIALQPDSADERELAATVYLFQAKALLAAGERPGAAAATARALSLAEGLVRKDPSVELWNGYLLGGGRLMQMRIAAQAARSPDQVRAALAPAVAESARLLALTRSRAPNLRMARVAADALLLAGDHEALSGRPQAAIARWAQAASVCLCRTLDSTAPAAEAQTAAALARVRLKEADALRGRAAAREGHLDLATLKRRWLETYLW